MNYVLGILLNTYSLTSSFFHLQVLQAISHIFSSYSILKDNMISPKKLIKLAKKWQKVAALSRKRISLPKDTILEESSTAPPKGHFVVYTIGEKRFVFPIVDLNKYIFKELLRMSEEEFGLPGEGPIKLPFDAVTMEYIVSMMQRNLDGNMEKTVLLSLSTSRCLLGQSFHQGQNNQPLLITSF